MSPTVTDGTEFTNVDVVSTQILQMLDLMKLDDYIPIQPLSGMEIAYIARFR